MKAWFLGFCLCLILSPLNALAREKVILDTDMVVGFDDGIAMLMLAKAPSVELLGVTIVAGNTWVEEGTALALLQLTLNEVKNVPVAMGMNEGLRPQRRKNLHAEQLLFGQSQDDWNGAFDRRQYGNWDLAYCAYTKAFPAFKPLEQHAVDFIIEQVRKHPGEVTIAAIGPCTNLALAVRKAPDIVPLIKQVIYMGGAFYQPGNSTPAAEFNFWFDPEAARIAVNTPFARQIFVSLDVCEKVLFTSDHYRAVKKALSPSPYVTFFGNRSQLAKDFESGKIDSYYVWDVLVAALIIWPELLVESREAEVDVNDQFGLSYGQSLAYKPGTGPVGSQKGTIVLEIDQEAFWSKLIDACKALPKLR